MSAGSESDSSFKSSLKTEAKSASIYTLSTFLTQFGSFLVVPFFWQKLSVVDYGIIAIIDIISSFLTMFLGLQLDLSISRFYNEWPENERPERVGTLWVISWVSTIVLGIMSIALVSVINKFLFPDINFYPYIFLGLISVIIAKLSTVPYATIRIANKPLLYSGYSIASFIIQITLNIYFVLILDQKLNGYFISTIIGSIIIGILGILIMLRFARPCIKLDKIRESLKFSLPQIPASTIAGVTTMLDRFLLQRFASLEVMGIYSLSLKFTSLILQLHSALKISFLPFLYRAVAKDNKAGISDLIKMRLFYVLPLIIFALAISLYIKDFVQWISKPEYFPIITWVPWLIGPALVSSCGFYFAPGLFLAKRTDLTWIPAAVQSVTVLICGVCLIPSWNILGVVIAKYASSISLFLVTFFLSEKFYPIPVKWIKISSMVGLVLLAISISDWLEINNLIESIVFNTLLIISFTGLSLAIIGPFNLQSFISTFRKKNA